MLKKVYIRGKLVLKLGDDPNDPEKLTEHIIDEVLTEDEDDQLELKLDHLGFLAQWKFIEVMRGSTEDQFHSFEYKLELGGEIGSKSYKKGDDSKVLDHLFSLDSESVPV